MNPKLLLNILRLHFFISSEHVRSRAVCKAELVDESHLSVCNQPNVSILRYKADRLLQRIFQFGQLFARYGRVDQKYENRL